MFYTDYHPAFIFIHIPRTGGTSLTHTWGMLPYVSKDVCNHKHLTAWEIKHWVGEAFWHQAYKFTILRDPWEAIVSLWRLTVASPRGRGGLDWQQSVDKWKSGTFSEWVDYELGRIQPGGFVATFLGLETGIHVFGHVQKAHESLIAMTGETLELSYLEGSDKTIQVDDSRRADVLNHCWTDVQLLAELQQEPYLWSGEKLE